MKLNELSDNEGATKARMRVGRGVGSGKGKTSGRGVKGQKSRRGVSINGFEGGQMPIQRRLPKFGFKNFNRVEYKPLNLDVLQFLATEKGLTEINLETLRANGLISKNDLVKVLGRGQISTTVNVQVHKFSKSAADAIQKAGGSIVEI
jgi:large subunit ribosomal protein L15